MCMNLQELKNCIDWAIKDCEQVIEQDSKAILSEGDFERLLSSYISKRIGYDPKRPNPDAFAVHSQISHYKNDTGVLDARVDLVLMRPNEIKPDISRNKQFIYTAKESFAIELKYRHIDKDNNSNNETSVKAAKEDIDKYDRYKDDSYYYAVILLDEVGNISKYETEILSYYEKKKKELGNEYENKFFCKVLKKKPE